MKKIIFLCFLITFSFGTFSKQLPIKSKTYLLENLPSLFKDQFNAPEIQACWYQGINGNDDALSALFVIYKSTELVQKNADNTKAYYKKHIVDGQFTGSISEMLKQRDYAKLKKVVKMMPRAIKYCESFIPKEGK